jgi:hypothetical protein
VTPAPAAIACSSWTLKPSSEPVVGARELHVLPPLTYSMMPGESVSVRLPVVLSVVGLAERRARRAADHERGEAGLDLLLDDERVAVVVEVAQPHHRRGEARHEAQLARAAASRRRGSPRTRRHALALQAAAQEVGSPGCWSHSQ